MTTARRFLASCSGTRLSPKTVAAYRNACCSSRTTSRPRHPRGGTGFPCRPRSRSLERLILAPARPRYCPRDRRKLPRALVLQYLVESGKWPQTRPRLARLSQKRCRARRKDCRPAGIRARRDIVEGCATRPCSPAVRRHARRRCHHDVSDVTCTRQGARGRPRQPRSAAPARYRDGDSLRCTSAVASFQARNSPASGGSSINAATLTRRALADMKSIVRVRVADDDTPNTRRHRSHAEDRRGLGWNSCASCSATPASRRPDLLTLAGSRQRGVTSRCEPRPSRTAQSSPRLPSARRAAR